MPHREPPRRELGIDGYRGLAVLLMFVVHARRLEAERTWGGVTPAKSELGAESALGWFMWGEPFIAASFLFIVGFSLVLARERARDGRAWFLKLVRRALGLYVLAVALFVPQYGWALPDLLLSPGILSAIAVATVLVGGALLGARPMKSSAWLTMGVLLTTAVVDGLNLSVSGLNAGPGGAFPLVAFASTGALLALAYRSHGRSALHLALGLALVSCVAVLALGDQWTTTRVSFHPHYGSDLALTGIFSMPAERVPVEFWNHSVPGYLGLLLPVIGMLELFTLRGSWLESPPLAALRLIGRHALVVYVGHLIVLGLLEMAGLNPPTPWHTWGVVAALAVIAAIAGVALEASKRRPTSPPAVVACSAEKPEVNP